MAVEEPHLSEAEEREVEERSPPKAKVVHAAVIKQGEDELERPTGSLFWSGLAAGIAIMASVAAQGALHQRLPDAPWRELVAGFGYSLGFLIVILGRMQLFTEHTMVAVLPLARDPSWPSLGRTARLWAIVFSGNVAGAAVIAAAAIHLRLQSTELTAAMLEVSSKLLDETAAETLLQGIPAGFLIASVAWIRSASNGSSFWIILVLTYAIAICGFTHVVAGAAEAFLLLWSGKAGAAWLLGGFLLPAFAGNVIGGTGLFAMLAHAQVKEEL
ncbi:MAG: formate/nitrite transporter family protein [Alphaproteobacteria bacterium]|nr:formate/nitrite transporter family protein [Alphaproteobacteria bacterium]MBV9370174.1 formate/nitrite transporter family protein [Alphaproteobacteria bacterium]MBV9901065.1 formate/nitrite transporter family protein [Alphaproteobacteria bacterium]